MKTASLISARGTPSWVTIPSTLRLPQGPRAGWKWIRPRRCDVVPITSFTPRACSTKTTFWPGIGRILQLRLRALPRPRTLPLTFGLGSPFATESPVRRARDVLMSMPRSLQLTKVCAYRTTP